MIFEDGDLEEILAYGSERSWVEFNSPGLLSNRHLVAQIVRAMMAMANSQDGGLVVVGVKQDGATFVHVGLDADELASWVDEDAFADRVAAWADPPVRYRLHRPEVDGRRFVVINVEEFDREPVICRKGYDDVLAEGACYVRPRRKPESVPVRSTADMRDLIRLAADKELRDFLARAGRAGLGVGPTDDERFDDQLAVAQAVAPDVLGEVESRGHWRLTVRPFAWETGRVPFEDLEDLVRRAVIQLRGWDFPHIDHRTPIRWGTDWVGQGSSWNANMEVWRIWTSGQFASLRAFREDWRDRSNWSPPLAGWEPGHTLGILESLTKPSVDSATNTHIIEALTSQNADLRVALPTLSLVSASGRCTNSLPVSPISTAGDDEMHISLTAVGLAERRLVIDDPGRVPLEWDYDATIDEYPAVLDVATSELVADPMILAARAARRLFMRFGWTPDEAVLLGSLTRFRDSR